jgi:hypothetical protein
MRQPGEARAVIVVGVPFAKDFNKAGAARVTILAQPRIPTSDGISGLAQERFIACGVKGFERRFCDGHDGLHMTETNDFLSDISRIAAIFALMSKENSMIIQSDVGIEASVKCAFVRPAFKPNATIFHAFDEYIASVLVNAYQVTFQPRQRRLENVLQSGVGS